MRRLALLLPITLLLAACGGDGNATPTATTPPATATATTTATTTPTGETPAATATAAGDVAVCLRAEHFASDGEIAVAGSTAEAVGGRVLDLRWDAHDGCERLVIDLGAESGSAAAAPGTVSAALIRDLGVVRVRLPGAESVEPAATERMIDGALAHAAYVVRSRDGGLYVDVHLGAAAEAAVLTLADPARVVVDLRPGGGAIPAPAEAADRVVMLTPRAGAAAYPLTVTGYARTFEANVVARIVQGDLVIEDHTTATDWLDAWGEFSITFADGPTAAGEVQAGEYSARDGAWQGTAVAVDLR